MAERLDTLLRESSERRQVAKELVVRARSIFAKSAQTCEESRQLEQTLIAIKHELQLRLNYAPKKRTT